MAELPYANEELPEDDGVLDPDESLETDDLSQDPLDTGLVVPDGWSPAEQFGSTRSDARTGESLDRLLSEEEPEAGPDDQQDADTTWPVDSAPEPRAGRLVAGDEGSRRPTESEVLVFDVGVDADAASPEEEAVHLIPDEGQAEGR
jgi:hypothetical protein